MSCVLENLRQLWRKKPTNKKQVGALKKKLPEMKDKHHMSMYTSVGCGSLASAEMDSTAVAIRKCKLTIRSAPQRFQHSRPRMRVGSSSNGNVSTAWLASPRWLPLAPDSVLESFSEYGGMRLNSSLASSSCSSSSLSSICKKTEREIPPINTSSDAWKGEQHL